MSTNLASWAPERYSTPPSAFFAEKLPTTANINQNFQKFQRAWNQSERISESHPETEYIFVRGLFGNWMPGNLIPPIKFFRSRKRPAQLMRLRSHASIRQNSALIRSRLSSKLASNKNYIFLCHSKGGIDTLRCFSELNREQNNLLSKVKGVVMIQSPREAAPVLDRVWEKNRYDASHLRIMGATNAKWTRRVLELTQLQSGALSLTTGCIEAEVNAINVAELPFPVLSAGTWSSSGSYGLDTHHEFMNQARPGIAHDGQFWLHSQLWPGARQLVLGEIDHSQPANGGKGLDHCKLWWTLAHSFEEMQ